MAVLISIPRGGGISACFCSHVWSSMIKAQFLIEREIVRDGCHGYDYVLLVDEEEECDLCGNGKGGFWNLKIMDNSWERWIEICVERHSSMSWSFYLYEWKLLLQKYEEVMLHME